MFRVRPMSAMDAPGRILNVVSRALPRDPVGYDRFVAKVLTDPNLTRDGLLVAESSDGVVGFCLAIGRQIPLENAANDSHRGYITLLAVNPDHWGGSIGSGLLSAAEEVLRGQGRSEVWISPYAPNYFTPGVDVEACVRGLNFLLKRGYEEVYRPIAMEVDLWERPTEPVWVGALRETHGYEVNRLWYGTLLPVLDFLRREFPGDWVRVVREAAPDIMVGGTGRRQVLVASEGGPEKGRILGFSHFDCERFGPIGVAPSERGKGVGQALMFETLRQQQEQGLRKSWFMWSDDRTAERLYHHAGFREIRRFAVLRKEL